jgi:hypothetical protein
LVEGARSLKAAESLQNLATVHDLQGNVREAEVLYRAALSIYNDCKIIATEVHQITIFSLLKYSGYSLIDTTIIPDFDASSRHDASVTLNNLGLLLGTMNRCGEVSN